MLLIPTLLFGFLLMWFGYTFFLTQSNETYKLAYSAVPADSVMRGVWLREGSRLGSLAFRFVGGGLVVCVLMLPMVWWWFDARKKSATSAL